MGTFSLRLLILGVISCCGLEEAAAAPFTFDNTGSLAAARENHTATLLSNGKVLVVGGFDGSSALASAELYDPTSGTWSATGGLATARRLHTATLLPNGKVLVAGGVGSSGYLTSAELYDPASGSWAATNSLATAREYHTATLLPNGKVLVAGGYNSSSGYLASAELYDPTSGTWSATNSLATARYVHTATLLPNGKVLVAGGVGNSGLLASAELYDPTSGTWSATNSLAASRYYHTATLLPNGKVLVAGGFDGSSALASAELFDPASGTWTATNSLAAARYIHTATLLPNGKVLVAGGFGTSSYLASAELYDPTSGTWSATGSLATARYIHTATLLPNGKVLVAGGVGNSGLLASAELYDPASGTWTATNSLATARYVHTATLLPNGKVLVAGGGDESSFTILASAELFDPTSGTWTATNSLATARENHTATLLPNGNVLVAGGFDGTSFLASAELYDPASGTWTTTGSLATARFNHTATLLPNGKVLVAGGGNSSFNGLASAELYDPTSGTWTTTGSLATARFNHTATLLPNGKVLVAGGYNSSSGNLASAELYDPASGTWTVTNSLAASRYQHTATLLPNGKVLVAGGGNSSGYLTSAELFDPASGTWTATNSLATARRWHTATLLPNGKVLVAGGVGNSGLLASAELYDPTSGTWSATNSLAASRYYHTATLLPNGKVLVAGGGGSSSNSAALASVELYDIGLGFLRPDWQPQIATATSLLKSGSSLTLTGSRFQGISQASGGNFQDSSSNYPIVQLRSLESNQVAFLLVDPTAGWSDTAFTSKPVTGFPFGPALVTVFTNGIPSDTKYLVVAKATPTITTQASATTPVGGSISDTATLANGGTPSGTITFKLFGPDDATCGSTAVFTSTKNVTGNGSYTSDSFTSTTAGTYRWVATYSGDTNNNSIAGACNDANESVVVSKKSPTITTTASAPVALGGSVSDSATLAGGFNPAGTITFTLYGPNDATCGGTVIFTSTVSVNAGNGTYASANFTPTASGTYRWIATYNGDANNNIIAGACNAANESVVVTPAPTPTPTPTPTPGLVGNVSTRLPVGTGDNVLIEGFIVQGPAGSTKKIIARAIGPSLAPFGITDALANPTLEIHDSSGATVATNDDWRTTQVGGLITGDQSAEISASQLAPSNDLESAIIANLTPGSYTAVVRGVGNTIGTGVVDAYDLSPASPAKLANVATRGLIQPGDKLMIAGFIVQNGPVRAVIRAIGPSLSAFGISNALPDTTLQLRDQNGAIVVENDDWKVRTDGSSQQAELEATGLQPTNDLEAAVLITLQPGQYTAQVRGKPESTGIGVVQVYFLQ